MANGVLGVASLSLPHCREVGQGGDINRDVEKIGTRWAQGREKGIKEQSVVAARGEAKGETMKQWGSLKQKRRE